MELRQGGGGVAGAGDRDGIEAREGLVEEHDRWIGGERAGDLAAAPLAAGESHGRRVAEMLDMKFAQELLEPLLAHPAVGLGDFEDGHDVLDRKSTRLNSSH